MSPQEIRTKTKEHINIAMICLSGLTELTADQLEILSRIYKTASDLQRLIDSLLKFDMSEKPMQQAAESQIAIGNENSQVKK